MGVPEGVMVDEPCFACAGCGGQTLRTGLVAKSAVASVQTYPFYPHAGLLAGDLYFSNYTDRVSDSGIGDYELGQITYDGHRGIDSNLLFWSQQDAGFPIYAVLEGIVTATNDGEPDRNTVWDNQTSNFVIIDHGNGHVTRYFHLKKDSVAVSVGETVSAGQQIGLTGSSGISTAPHLHFETTIDSNTIEPFAGPGRTGSSLWQQQPEYVTETYVREFIVSPESLSSWPGLPEPFPNTGTLVASSSPQSIYFWWYLINRPENFSYLLRIYRPDGTLATSTGNTFPSSARRGWIWRSRNLVFDVVGTWTVELTSGEQVLFSGPLEVVASAEDVVNRPPVSAEFQFRKALTTEDDVPVCEAAQFILADDPDYDFVSYRYVWYVNGTEVRNVLTGAKSDALARSLIQRGDTVVCEVTPTDLEDDAPTVRVETVISEGFAKWAERVGQPQDQTADPDNDGLNLGLEYLLGYSPTLVESMPQILLHPEIHWALPESVFNALSDWQVLYSNDLSTWTEAVPGTTPGTWIPVAPSKSDFFQIVYSIDSLPTYSVDVGELVSP
ncbi:MAG: M23 family metallopeptidase [Verrucomicrobiota bacterium]